MNQAPFSSSPNPEPPSPVAERPIGQVRGTRDWLPDDFAGLVELEALLLDRFARAGYNRMRTPVLEFTELHERKSGAGIVSKLYELAGGNQGRLCLRPELTASIARAYTAATEAPPLPWRVSLAGPVFRYETPQPSHYREFEQVGVELLGASGPAADGEIVWLADWALAQAGVKGARIRLGHVGLILEMLRRSGLPAPAQAALIEMLSEAASEGRNVRSLEQGLEQIEGWLASSDTGDIPLSVEQADDSGVDRLFRTLVPVIMGRRSGHEILHRLRRKWDLGHSLLGVLERVRNQVHDLADLRGPAGQVLERLARDYQATAPESVAALRALVDTLADYGVELDRVELDLGFGRGIGFYSQMIFELIAPTPDGPVEVCGGGRYDGLARVLGSDRDDRGVGFACGLERLSHVLELQGRKPTHAQTPRGCLVVAQSSDLRAKAVRVITQLRALNHGQWLDDGPLLIGTERPLSEAEDYAQKLGLAAVVFVRDGLGPKRSWEQFDWVAGSWVESRE
ncbi:MAG TPA: ATP phosphoribosyltransferase regulatory subunit [Isosphaeraceae bacterium]|jgi:histidyl-tRNA synthetase|nr:ATP phosphoribosyltransferase regulatory subunit [Isosphaeraceae bacterium]